jgi:cytochrome c-type biogenesis protein CcmH/NrfG
VYYEQNKLELAIQTYTRALQLEPNFPEAYNNLVRGTGTGACTA